MHDLLDNPEIAAASKVCGGRFGQHGRILLQPTSFTSTSNSSTPRAARSRGVSVFAPVMPAAVATAAIISAQTGPAPASMGGRVIRQAPPAITRAAPVDPAGLRIV